MVRVREGFTLPLTSLCANLCLVDLNFHLSQRAKKGTVPSLSSIEILRFIFLMVMAFFFSDLSVKWLSVLESIEVTTLFKIEHRMCILIN